MPTCPGYGRPDFSTPNIDHIAAQGLRFLQAYANSAVCTATRTALITGRYQYRLRLGLEEPCAETSMLGFPQNTRRCPRFEESWLRHDVDRQVASGFLPKFGPLKSGYDHFYGFAAGP